MAHALRKYARHVQKVLTERLPRKPPYQWCLQMVQRNWPNVKDLRAQDKKAQLTRIILPIAVLQLQVEERFTYLPGHLLDEAKKLSESQEE